MKDILESLVNGEIGIDEAEKILTNNNGYLDDFGYLLDLSWQLKKKTGREISSSKIDALYYKGIQAGALGGKLLGAGGGGFLLFYVPPKKQEEVIDALKDCLLIPYHFENDGTKIIYFSPETDNVSYKEGIKK